jgi:hypothetical protein
VNREHLYGFTVAIANRRSSSQTARLRRLRATGFGGCRFLTDAKYSSKLQIWGRRAASATQPRRYHDAESRPPRLPGALKVIVARDDGENNFPRGIESSSFICASIAESVDADRRSSVCRHRTAARIAARYGQGRDAETVTVSAHHPNGVVEGCRWCRWRCTRFRTPMSSAEGYGSSRRHAASSVRCR